MTYGMPRRAIKVKGNVTFNSAKRGLTKRDANCSTCYESTDYPLGSCGACADYKIPLPMVTLNGFEGNIDGSYPMTRGGGSLENIDDWGSYLPLGGSYGRIALFNAYGCDIYHGWPAVSSQADYDRGFRIDAQWPMQWINHLDPDKTLPDVPLHDSTFLDGRAGLRCRAFDYTDAGGEDRRCDECTYPSMGGMSIGQLGIPTSLPAEIQIATVFTLTPVEIEMGWRTISQSSNTSAARRQYGGGIWTPAPREHGFDRWIQIQAGRRFSLQPGVIVFVHKQMDFHKRFGWSEDGKTRLYGWRTSVIGDIPNATAVYHAPIPQRSATAYDDETGYSLFECGGLNLNLSLVAKTEHSDAQLSQWAGVSPAPCQGAPEQDPPYIAQTTTLYNEVNDFGTAGTVRLSTSSSILDLFLGDDFAAEMKADASVTVTDG